MSSSSSTSASGGINPISQIISKLINHYLSHFFENAGTKHKFTTSLRSTSNSLQLNRLQFRKYVMEDILREVGLLERLLMSANASNPYNPENDTANHAAFQIHSGFIENLLIHVPWQLQKKSIKVKVKGVCILLTPTSHAQLTDMTASNQRALHWKQLKLNRWEDKWSSSQEATQLKSSKKKHKRTSSFTSFLKNKTRRKSVSSEDSQASPIPPDSPASTTSTDSTTSSTAGSKSSSSQLEGGFFDRLLETIVNNIQIEIEDVHIRYEDQRDPKNPFALGACIKQLLINTTDENWAPQFTREIQDVTFKRVSCSGFSVYLNHPLMQQHGNTTQSKSESSSPTSPKLTEKHFLSKRNFKRKLPPIPSQMAPKKKSTTASSTTPSLADQQDEFDKEFIDLMKEEMYAPHNQSIISPAAAHLKLKMQKLSKSIIHMKKPQFDAEVDFQEVKTNMSDLQYRTLMELVDYVTNFATYSPYRRFRPLDSVKKHPRAWWDFALTCIKNDNRKQHIYWHQLRQFNADRKRYIELFKKKQEVSWLPKLTDTEKEELNQIESRTSLNNLIFFRKLSRVELAAEQKQHAEWRRQQIKPKNLFSDKNTFFKKLLVLTPEPGTIQIDEETKLELYKSIGYTNQEEEEEAQTLSELNANANYVRMCLKLNLTEFDLTFSENGSKKMPGGEIERGASKDIVRARFGGLTIDTQFMSQSFKTDLNATKFELLDCQSEHEMYRYAVRRRDYQSQKSLVSMSLIKNPHLLDSSFTESYETINSRNGTSVDYYFGLSLDHVNIIVNIQFIRRLFSFLNVDHVNYHNLEVLARENIEKVKTVARDELRKALESKVALDLDIHINSPVVMVPIDCTTAESQVLLLDLGAFSSRSELNKARQKLVQHEQQNSLEESSDEETVDSSLSINIERTISTEDALQYLNASDVKDNLFLIFDDIRVLVPQKSAQQVLSLSQESAKELFLEAFHHSEHLIDKMSFQVKLAQSLLPQEESIPRLQVSSSVPRIDLNISPEKVKILLLLMDKISDFIENPTGASDSDLRLRGNLMLNGPLSNGKWVKARVEVRSTRKVFIYERDSEKLLGSIKLSKDTSVKPSRSKDKIFRLDLPQEQEVISFFFACDSADTRTQWITELQQLIFSFHTNFYIGNFATMVLKDLKSSMEHSTEQSGVVSLMTPKSQKQTLLGIDFQLDHFCAHVRDSASLPLLNVDFSRLSLDLILNSVETTVKTQLYSVSAVDLITEAEQNNTDDSATNDDTPKNYIIKSVDSDALVDIFLVYAREQSSHFSTKSAIRVSTKFHGVHVFVEPSLLTHSIQFFYDILDVLDLIDLQKNVYQEFKKKIITSGKFKNILQIDFTAGAMDLQMLNKGAPVCLFSIPGMDASLLVNTKRLNVSGRLHNVVALDQSTENSAHSTILGLTHEDVESMISFDYTQNLQTGRDLTRYSKSLQAKMQHIRYVHVQRFISVLRNYTMEQMQHASQRQKKRSLSISSRQQEEQGSGQKDRVEDVRRWKALSLIELDIEIVDPTIVLPVHYDDPESTHFFANLGHIFIKNHLQPIGEEEANEQDAVPSLSPSDEPKQQPEFCRSLLEQYHIKPTNMKLELVSPLNTSSPRQHIVEHVDMEICVRSVILNASRTTLPKRSVSIDFSSLSFDMNHQQFQTIFDAFNHNIRDGLEDINKEQLFYKTIGKISQSFTQKLRSDVISHSDSSSVIDEEMGTVGTPTDEAPDHSIDANQSKKSEMLSELHTKSQITVSAPEMAVTLHKGDSLNDPIIKLCMEGIHFENMEYSDSSSKGVVTLRSMEGLDIREDSTNQFKKLFDSQTSVPDVNESLDEISQQCIRVTFSKSSNNHHDCTVRLSDPRIVFVPSIAKDFINYLTTTQFIGGIGRHSTPQADQVNSDSHSETSSSTRSKKYTNFSLQAYLGHPEIIFPENCEDKESRLLCLSFSAQANFSKNQFLEKGKYEIKDFCAFVRFNDMNLPDSLSASLMDPVTVHTELMTNYHSESKMTERRMLSRIKGGSSRISYQDIKMIFDIFSSFNFEIMKGSNMEALDETLEEGMLLKEWISQNLRNSPLLLQLTNRALVNWTFTSTNPFHVLVVDDIKGYDVPLLNLTLSKLKMKGLLEQKEGKDLVALADIQLRLDLKYFNFSIAEWEPVLEATKHPLHIHYEHKPPSLPLQNAVDHISVICQDVLDVNVTHSMIETMVKTCRLWLAGLHSPKSMISLKFEPFAIRNYSGLNVKFYFPHVETVDEARQVTEDEVRFSIPNSSSNQQKNMTIGLIVENTEKRIYVNKVANFFIKYEKDKPLSQHGATSNSQKSIVPSPDTTALGASHNLSEGFLSRNFCCVHIVLDEARKVITVNSGVSIENRTQLPWEVAVSSKENLEEVSVFGSIQPNQKCYIPAQYLDSKYQLRVRPGMSLQTLGMYSWSRAKKSCHIHELFSKSKKKILVDCKTEKSSAAADDDAASTHSSINSSSSSMRDVFYCVLNVNCRMEHNVLLSANISLVPPLCIENLLASSAKIQLYWEKNQKNVCVYSTNIMAGEREYIHTVNMRHNLWMQSSIIGDWKSRKAVLIYDAAGSGIPLASTLTNEYVPTKKKLLINLDYNTEEKDISFQYVSLYCPYWIVNHTKKNIQVKVGTENIAGHLSAFEPLMFNYISPSMVFSNSINLQVGTMFQSPPFSIDTPGTYGNICVTNGSVEYELGVDVELAPAKFHRTTVVTLTPRYMLVNKTGEPIYFREHKTDHQLKVESNSSAPFYNISSNKDSRFPMICSRTESSQWSSPMRIDSNRNFVPMLWNTSNKTTRYASLQVYQEKSIVFVVFEFTNHAPYMIHNESKFVLNIAQKGTSKWTIVEKGDPYPFSWDDQNGSHILMIKCSRRSSTASINLDDVRAATTLRIGNETAHIHLRTNGQTRTVVVREKPDIRSPTENKYVVGSSSTAISANEPEKTLFQVSFHLAGVGISMIDQKPQEFLYTLVEGIQTSITMTNMRQYFDLQAKRIQANNQLPDALLPVAFTNSKKLADDEVFLRVSLVRSYQEKDFHSFPFFSFVMQEADFSLDLNFTNKITNFFLTLDAEGKSTNEFSRSTDSVDAPLSEQEDIMDHLNWIREPVTELDDSKKTYFQSFQIHPLKFNLTFLFNQREEAVLTKRNAMVSLLESIGAQFNMNIEDSPLSFDALVLQHPFMTRRALTERVAKHYQQRTVTEIYKAIGSFDFLGNPIGLFHDLDTGVYDLFYEPLEALMTNPSELSRGLARGSASFVKHSIHGTFNTASKMTESLGNTLSYLSMDSEYINSRQKLHRKENPRHAGEGFISGFQSLGSGVFEGLTGVVTKPLVGATEEGFTGFFTGVGKGIVGVPVKPMTAILDFATKTTKGIRNTTTYFEKQQTERTRFPRVLGMDGKLISYDQVSAQTQFVLHQTNNGKYVEDRYIAHAVLKELRSLIILSDKRIICVVVPSHHIEWEVDVLEIGELKVEHKAGTGTFFVVLLNELGKKRNQGGWFSGAITEYRAGPVQKDTGEQEEMAQLISRFKWLKRIAETHDLETSE